MRVTDRTEPVDVVFLDRATLPEETRVRPLGFAHRLVVHESTTPAEVAERIAGAQIVITNKAPIRAEAIAAAPRLRLVAVAATGTDVVDLAACAARGVSVCNIRNYAVHTVPEHTFALILALRRSILAYRDSVRNGRWQESGQFCFFDHPIHDLAGATLGIIGDGVLGRSVADIGKAFGMRVLFAAYKGSAGMGPLYTAFEDVLAQSDVITLHSPLMPSTRNMIGAAEFAAMARRPLLINTARGGLVDEQALHDALVGGQIAGAGFDVVTAEPPPADHVMMRLLGLPNFILTPHVAWSSREAIQGLADQLIENIELFMQGTPRHLVGG
ncbi:D-2-hydroxyacid dehydrogenase [Labrys monachus]|nr:D-2-hydroxyacid dehydrogenase [Labrys monachus]